MNKLKQLYKKLLKEYGHQGWWPLLNKNTKLCEYHKGSPQNDTERFEIIVGAILTQNTSWKNVEKALCNLKKENILGKKKILNVKEKKLAQIIRPAGYFNLKAKKLKKAASFFTKNKNPTRKQLLEVWGIGPETADSILLYAFNKPFFVVDAYTHRVMERLGYSKNSYDSLQKLFHNNVPKNVAVYNEFHALIVEHGKNTCTKTKPNCNTCCLSKICPSKNKF